jgi:hypothetical protein
VSCGDVVIRDVTIADVHHLQKFRCASEKSFERDVEDFIRHGALSLMNNSDLRSRLFHGAWHGDELVGLTMHEAEIRFDEDCTYIRLVAVSQAWQGVTLEQGGKVVDRLMLAVRARRTAALASADIHDDNLRSLAVFTRYVNVIFSGDLDEFGMRVRAGEWR